MKLINDVEHLYEKRIKELPNGKFECPVCGKQYSTRAGINKHYEKRDCCPTLALFIDTTTEEVGFDIYQAYIGEFNPRARLTLAAFRKTKYYTATLTTVVFLMRNMIKSAEYMAWIHSNKKVKHFNGMLAISRKDDVLREFRDFMIKNEHLIDSEQFFLSNQYDLTRNDTILVRSLERADIGVKYCVEKAGILSEDRVRSMPLPIYERFIAIVNMVS